MMSMLMTETKNKLIYSPVQRQEVDCMPMESKETCQPDSGCITNAQPILYKLSTAYRAQDGPAEAVDNQGLIAYLSGDGCHQTKERT